MRAGSTSLVYVRLMIWIPGYDKQICMQQVKNLMKKYSNKKCMRAFKDCQN